MTSPFAQVQLPPKPSLWVRLSARRTQVILAVCLVVGLGLVWWWAQTGVNNSQHAARAEAQAYAAALELQLSQPAVAAELLGAVARHGRSGLTNFQKVATELFTAHPGLACLELQPGGIVSDIVPRAGYERAIGFNVLKDAGQRAGANEAIARRVLTVSGPVRLHHGEQGIIARVPLSHRTPDGRDSFWGFVAVSMRFQEALARAGFDQPARQAYQFLLYAPASPQHGLAPIASQGLSSPQDCVQQPVRSQNLELRLALRPRGGWVNKGEVALDLLAVALLSVLIPLLLNLAESRRAVEADLTEATQQLAREQTGRNQALADCCTLKGKLSATQAELHQAQLLLQPAQSKAAELQAQFETSLREKDQAVQAHQEQQQKTSAALAEAQAIAGQLQGRLDAAIQAEENGGSAAEQRLQQNQAALLEVKGQLEAAEARAARLGKLEQSHRELKARLLVLEGAEARVVELEGLLQTALEELAQRQTAPSQVAEVLTREDPSGTEADSSTVPAADSIIGPGSATEEPAPIAAPQTGASSGEPPTAVEVPQTPQSTNAVTVALPSSAPPTLDIAPQTESPGRPPARAPKVRKTRRDGQMDFFKGEDSKPGATDQPTTKRVVPPVSRGEPEQTEPTAPVPQAREKETAPARRLPPAPPVDPAQLRRAANLIVPLLTDQDPGAKDCLHDNRMTFRSAFTPEGYAEFEQLVKDGDFEAALEQLKKAARKHGLSL